ncbi:hypothetical protein D3C76_1471710 [compost metagenome]
MAVHPSLCRRDQRRVVSQPEIVIGAEVDHLATIGHRDIGLLGRRDNALLFKQPFGASGSKLLFQLLVKRRRHSVISRIGAFSAYFTALLLN